MLSATQILRSSWEFDYNPFNPSNYERDITKPFLGAAAVGAGIIAVVCLKRLGVGNARWNFWGGNYKTRKGWRLISPSSRTDLSQTQVIARKGGNILKIVPDMTVEEEAQLLGRGSLIITLNDNPVGTQTYRIERDCLRLLDIVIGESHNKGIASAVTKWLALLAARQNKSFGLINVRNPLIERIIVSEKIFRGPFARLQNDSLDFLGTPSG
ncbi:MAG: hypothetical protein HYT76_01695 [Deltaproteobacteria bacterium]|nr:hypothetical protein [Deltaproteobacteria bacterium]